MNIRFTDESIELEELDAFLTTLLLQLPDAAGTDDPQAHERLYPGLTRADGEANAEWAEFVQPGLRELFRSHVSVVEADLKTMRSDAGMSSLSVSREHAVAWIHTLNQARLALGTRHEVTEEDMTGPSRPGDPARAFALLQIEVYGIILSAFLEECDF